MISTPALSDQLGTLTAVLDDPGTDLHTVLHVLVDELSVAVSSFLGLRMTLQSEWFPVTLVAVDPDLALAAGTSLALPLSRSTGAGADLPRTSPPPANCGITGLAELSVVNQAIGVLITRGHTPAEARAELRSRTAVGLHSVTEVARHVLGSTNAPPPHLAVSTANGSATDR
jgi:hypothetical protein